MAIRVHYFQVLSRALLVWLVLSGCDRHESEEIVGLPPLKKVSFLAYTSPFFPFTWDQEVVIELHPGVKISSTVDMRLFDGFYPGITLDEAIAKFGKPKTEFRDEYGTWYEYSGELGRIAIICQEYGSPSLKSQDTPPEGQASGCQWTVYAYLGKPSDLSIFHSEVRKHVQSAIRKKANTRVIVLRIEGTADPYNLECWVRKEIIQRCTLNKVN